MYKKCVLSQFIRKSRELCLHPSTLRTSIFLNSKSISHNITFRNIYRLYQKFTKVNFMSLKNCQNIYSRTPKIRPLWDWVKAKSQKSQIIRFAQENPF